MNRVLLDMDGVCCDFTSAACQLHDIPYKEVREWNFFHKYGITEKEFWAKIYDAGEKFWVQLEEYPDFQESYERLKAIHGLEVYFCTTGAPGISHAYSGKVKWLESRFGKNFDEFILTKHKHLLANSNTLLIDDYIKNIKKFRNAGGKALEIRRPWNNSPTRLPTAVSAAEILFCTY